MIRFLALGIVSISTMVLFIIFREDRLSSAGKVPLGRLRRFWLQGERRRHPRYRIDWNIRYKRGSESPHVQHAQTRDVSQTGAGLVMKEKLDPGSPLHLEFAIPGKPAPLNVKAEVVWSRPVPQKSEDSTQERLFFVGIRFFNIDPQLSSELVKALGGHPQVPYVR